MSSKAKARALADDFDDDEVVSMLGLETPIPGDPEQWARDNNGDLDWSYTARIMSTWSQDALLTHLWEKSFSIPPREYNPSAPFVWVQLASGDVVTLPHGYRLPLMFVAKYRWETMLSKIPNARQWKQERANIFHLSRLCENLFRRAQAKASRGGMEKGWRCVMFDRLLARFYKHWARNDPEGGTGFLTVHGAKEYDRDVLKHDWKRWCLRGLNGVKMAEEEVTNGITIEQFRKSLKKRDDGVWIIDDQPLTHITAQEPPDYGSSSELTDYSIEYPSDDVGISDSWPHGDDALPNQNQTVVLSSQNNNGSRSPAFDTGNTRTFLMPRDDGSQRFDGKRVRDFSVDDDETERLNKRNRIEQVLRNGTQEDSSQRLNQVYPLSRTLAAMARNPVWAHTHTALTPGSGSTSQLPPESSSSAPIHIDLTTSSDPGPQPSTSATSIFQTPSDANHQAGYFEGIALEFDMSPEQQNRPPSPKPPMNSAMEPPASEDTTQQPSSHRLAFAGAAPPESASARPSRAASMKNRQPAVAPANPRPTGIRTRVTARRGLPRPDFAQLSANRARSQVSKKPQASSSRLAEPRVRAPLAQPQSPVSSLTPTPAPAANTTVPVGTAGEGSSTAVGAQAQQSTIHVTALELLEKLVDVKRVLQEKFPSASTPAGPGSNASGANAEALLDNVLDNASSAAAASANSAAVIDLAKAEEDKAALEAKLNDFEGQFAAIKAELKSIVERLQILEGSTPSRATEAAANALARTEGTNNEVATAGEEATQMDIDAEAPNPPEVPTSEPPTSTEETNGGDSGDGKAAEREDTDPTTSTSTAGGDMQSTSQPTAEKSSETVADKPAATDVGGGAEAEKAKEAEGIKDVVMDDAGEGDAPSSESGAVEAPPISLDGIPVPTSGPTQDGERTHSPVPQSQQQAPLQEDEARQSTHLEDTRPRSQERQTAAEHLQIIPTSTATHSPEIGLRTLDRDVDAHKHASSEPDTDITMVNTSAAASSSSTLLNEGLDPRTRDMSSSLNLLVDSLVSAKMLAVMEGMVKNRLKDREDEKEKAKSDPLTEGSVASSNADTDRERELDAPPHPLRSDSLALTHAAESHTLASLISELQSMKQEARVREQREKEELQAMRELHSAEVDALRRRLSYLETQNRHVDSMGQTMHSPVAAGSRYHSAASLHSAHAESSYQGHHAALQPGPHPHPPYGGMQYPNGKGHPRVSPVESELQVKETPPPVRIYTDRNFGFARPPDRDDEAPLPIKSQRKQHMVFPRAQYG